VTKYFPKELPKRMILAIAAMQQPAFKRTCPLLLELKTLILSLMNPYTILKLQGTEIRPMKIYTSPTSSSKVFLNKLSKLKSRNYLKPWEKLQRNRQMINDLSNWSQTLKMLPW